MAPSFIGRVDDIRMVSDTGPILTIDPTRAEAEMGTIASCETAKRRRYRVRYRKPDHTEAEERGFTTMGKAKLHLSMVMVAKAKGEYLDTHASRAPVSADSWLRSKLLPARSAGSRPRQAGPRQL